RRDEIDVGFERRFEPVLPALEPREHRNVVGRQHVLAGSEQVAELSEVHELDHLRFADDELGAALDFLVFVRKAIRQRVAGIISPLDNLDELALDEIHQSHARLSSGPAETGYYDCPDYLSKGSYCVIRNRWSPRSRCGLESSRKGSVSTYAHSSHGRRL